MLTTGYAVYQKREVSPFRRTATAAGGRASSVEFVVEPLPTPTLVRPDHELDVLYVRVMAPRAPASRVIAVLPHAGHAVRDVLGAAADRDEPVRRAVVVGADAVFAEPAASGHADAIAAFVDVVRALTDAAVPFVWRTRAGIDPGGLEPAIAAALGAAGRLCTVELGVAAVDDHDARALEGDLAAPFEARLRLAGALVARGLVVRALIDPLVPMLTDQQGPLEALVTALAQTGVRRLGARYITLTRDRAKVIAARLAGMQKALLQGVFADEPWQKPDDDTGPREVHKRIPPAIRRRGHERLIEVGARHGVLVEILDPVDDDELSRSMERAEQLHSGDHRASKAPGKPVRLRPQLDLFAVSGRKKRD